MSEKGDAYRELADKEDDIEEVQAEITRIKEGIQRKWLESQPIRSHDEIAKDYANHAQINLTEAKNALFEYPKKYEIEGKDIPALIKGMRKYRRKLKGETKVAFTKSIDNLIDDYADYLNKCIDSIYWVKKYKTPLKQMNYDENKLMKLNSITSEEQKREVVDVLCKYWEADLKRQGMLYGKEYAILTKEMKGLKKQFTQLLKETPISASPKDSIKKAILDSVCNNPGISSREIHDSLPRNLYNRSSPQIIAKLASEQNISNVDGMYYKINDDIKKNIWAYTAAFIDSDGYITMDRNHNPRVGLVATGKRGKAFMMEMHKSLGMGRLHLDQKSPQDTRLINRLNFYSGADIKKLLTKCLPHFKLKKKNASVLLELIKIKKENKKEDWYGVRKEELFKLMKYYNHSDNTRFDWKAWDIDIDGITKLEENTKMEF
ncbi:MAG: hypothetical protein GOVbin1753_32 [Prokaryotic dsDNA virus sp.]|nr:MAG: hypothetical protein GOVbin1753_32 [Prokaryotic dsDNA virus sp.]|tara:strand:+ start:3858 stop:5156 length:1299 start_codon:yes stop_codon:yes gene_type:complete